MIKLNMIYIIQHLQKNTKAPRLMLLLCLLAHVATQVSKTVAIQDTNQTFFAYVPLSQSCNYSDTDSVIAGGVYYEPLDPLSIFQSVQLVGSLQFWGAIRNGISIFYLKAQLLENNTYDQVVLFNSTINDNFTSRQFILTETTNQLDLVLFFATPNYSAPNSLSPILQSNWTSNFSKATTTVIQQCVNANQTLNIIYLGNMLYLGICPNTTTLIVWNISNNSQSAVFSSLPSLKGLAVKDIAPNPSNLLPFQTASKINPKNPFSIPYNGWNAALLVEDESTTLFCFFNLSQAPQCEDYQNEEVWLQIVGNRAWGLQALIEETQIQMVISEFPSIVNLTFPGNILSIFANGNTIFIQSQLAESIYLSIFDQGNQLANLTLPGYIIYFGQERLILQTGNDTFLIASFVLPMLYIQSEGQPNTITINATCNSVAYSFIYDIFWTNIEFPSAQVIQIKTSPVVSYQGILTLEMNNYYQVIGPAFQIFIADSSNLSITLLDTSYVVFTDAIITIIDLVFIKGTSHAGRPLSLIYSNKIGQIVKYFFRKSESVTISQQPCGLQSITMAQKLKKGYLLVDQNSDGSGCFCSQSFQSCQLISSSEMTTLMYQSSLNIPAFLSHMQQIQNQAATDANANQGGLKRQFFDLLTEGLVLNLYVNNTVSLVNESGIVVDSTQSQCVEFNSTEALIFTRNFYDDYLLLYCYHSSTMEQYILRKQQMIFNRIIPLYGFLTKGPESVAEAGANYIFIEVDPNPEYTGFYSRAFPIEECCILRLNPNAFTVSVIAEVILANHLIFVQSIFGADIVYYNQTAVVSTETYLKIYYDSSWISFQQTCLCPPWNDCTPITYQYQIAFNSLLYNFAACFAASITFDISSAQLSTSMQPLQNLRLNKIEGQTIKYVAEIELNFNQICGPIAAYSQQVVLQQNPLFSVVTNNIITPNKYLQFPQVVVLQIIDLQTIFAEITLAQLILVVSSESLTFYNKFTDQQVWLQQISVVTPSQNNCIYFAYASLNNTSAQLGTNCFNADIKTPLLTLSYDPSNELPLNATFSTMTLPEQLRDIESIVLSGLDGPLVFGIGEGPSKSISGTLFFCYEAWCNSLTVSTKVIFFIDYDVQVFGNSFLVVALDLTKISFWLNPSLPPAQDPAIIADFVMEYSQQLGYSCNKIQIVSANASIANMLLGCPSSYLQIQVALNQNNLLISNILNTFNKFINCASINKFKPVFQLQPGSNSHISLMIIQCQQNLDTVRLQQFESINNSQSAIITAYMQIYSPNGPFCGQAQWWPMRILPISTSMNFMLYQLYEAAGQLKILFEEIDGSLIDAFVDPSPTATYELIKLTKQLTFPEVQLNITNPYYQWLFFIQTEPQKYQTAASISYALYIVFGLTNLITLIFMLCWLLFARKSKRMQKLSVELNRLSKKSSISQTQSQSYKTPTMSLDRSEDSSSVHSSRRQSSLKPPVLRKVTEIELFQPRYHT